MNAASFHLDYPRFQVLETMARSTQHQHSFEQKEAGEIAGHARQQHCHRKRSFGLMYKCPRPTYLERTLESSTACITLLCPMYRHSGDRSKKNQGCCTTAAGRLGEPGLESWAQGFHTQAYGQKPQPTSLGLRRCRWVFPMEEASCDRQCATTAWAWFRWRN